MRIDEVPQDNSVTYAGHKKVLYARGDDGAYTAVHSSGWDAEASATLDAVALYDELAREAHRQVEAGEKSPLYFHMYACRMDLQLLSQVTGLWRWRIRRHFLPRHFRRLNGRTLERYAAAMDKTVAELTALPEFPL